MHVKRTANLIQWSPYDKPLDWRNTVHILGTPSPTLGQKVGPFLQLTSRPSSVWSIASLGFPLKICWGNGVLHGGRPPRAPHPRYRRGDGRHRRSERRVRALHVTGGDIVLAGTSDSLRHISINFTGKDNSNDTTLLYDVGAMYHVERLKANTNASQACNIHVT